MFSFTMVFEDEQQMRECRRLLTDRYSFTGEMTLRRRENGEWLMVAHSEKRFRDSTFEKIPGRRQDE